MNHRTLCCTFTLILAAGSLHAQDCPMGKPAVLSRAVPLAIGKGPIWMTAESLPIKWVDAGTPVQLIWLMDAEGRGPAIVAGKHRDSAAPVKFTKLGDRTGKRELRWRLDPLGYKPTYAKPGDFDKFRFDRSFGWFPEPGCYEITARFGTQESKIFVRVATAKSGT